MKLLRLDLRAFGPFSGQILDFSAAGTPLHIVYGPNEAGKSSALRALRQLLFGIDVRTTDSFLHPMNSMRIAAALAGPDGSVLECVRRKGNKNTLSDAADEKPLDEELLTRLHGGLEAATFQSLFGIDHNELVRGGQAILQGKGSLGETLFSAATGLSNLRAVTEEYEQQADGIFAPRGKRPLNQAISRYEEARKRVKSLSLPPREWQEQDRLLQAARGTLAQVEQRLAEVMREQARLTRFEQLLPLAAQYTEQLKQLQDLGQPPRLNPRFAAMRLQASTDLSMATERLVRAREQWTSLEQQVATQQVPQWLTADEGLFKQLEIDLGGYRAAQKDRPGLIHDRDRLHAEASALLRELRPAAELAEMEKLRVSRADQVRIRQLGTAHGKLSERLSLAQSTARQHETKMAAAEYQLQQLPPASDTSLLRAALRRVQNQGRLENEWESARQELAALEQQAAVELKKLALWRGTLAELESLAVPPSELIEQFDAQLTAIDSQLSQVAAQLEKNAADHARFGQQLEALQLEGAVPCEAELLTARDQREELWRRIKAGEAAVQSAALLELHAAYEAAVRVADELADRLRREAGRVTNRAVLDASQRASQLECQTLTARRADFQLQREELLVQWRELWKPLDVIPQPPRAMRAWCNQQQVVAAHAGELRRQRTVVQQWERQVAAARADLMQSLNLADAADQEHTSLAELLERAEQAVETQDQAQRIRLTATKQLEDLRLQKDADHAATVAAQQAWDEWMAAWTTAIQPLGLPADASPEQAAAVLELIGQVFEKLKEAQALADRITEIDRYSQGFEQQTRAAAERMVPELATRGAIEIGDRLLAEHKQAARTLAKLETLQKQQAAIQQEIESAEAAAQQARAQVAALCEEAGCTDARELPEIERRAAAVAQADTALQQTKAQLLHLGGGETIESLLAACAAMHADELPSQMAHLSHEREQLALQQTDLNRTIGSAQKALADWNGRGDAAEAEAEAQACLAEISELTEQYTRARLACAVLRRAMERYREKNQDPLVARASELFAELTCGGFTALRVDHAEGEPQLVGIRAHTAERVAVTGMSEGTADQLYLSLRLASLERHCATHQPAPFVVDDLLITFDNRRSVATLGVLLRLAQRTQVIFFTHHQHLVDLAKEHLPAESLCIHTLPGRADRDEQAVRQQENQRTMEETDLLEDGPFQLSAPATEPTSRAKPRRASSKKA